MDLIIFGNRKREWEVSQPKARRKPVMVFSQRRKGIFQGKFSFIWSSWGEGEVGAHIKLKHLDDLSTQSNEDISCSYWAM